MQAERRQPPAEVLGVYLAQTAAQSVRVGSLIRNQAAVTFLVDESYIERGPERPILSLAFHAMSGEDDTIARLQDRRDKTGTINVLPPYFANLLPEGALRAVVEAQLPRGEDNEFGMLKRLGGDLPGAVVIRDEGAPEAALLEGVHAHANGRAENEEDAALVKFSLAGVQMKFSMIEAGDRLALPAHGESGRLIVKLPSRDYPDLPEIEYGAMRLANAVGVTTAPVQLVPTAQVEGISEQFLRWGGNVLAVTRFDRDGDRRIHTEDFAQILGAVGDQKYRKANVETMVHLTSRFTPDPVASVLEMVRRILVDLMLGNGDSHLKNTSFIYADGRTPALSPAYDIVPTVLFNPKDDLALKFGGKRKFENIRTHEFERLATYVDVNPRVIAREITHTVERANEAWPDIIKDLPWPEAVSRKLGARWERLALFEGMRSPFG